MKMPLRHMGKSPPKSYIDFKLVHPVAEMEVYVKKREKDDRNRGRERLKGDGRCDLQTCKS